MADVKRANVSDRVATPRTASQPSTDHLKTLGTAIGARIKIQTAGPSPQTLEGTLFTACPTFNVVALNTSASSTTATAKTGDYHIIPISRIQSIQVLSLPNQPHQNGDSTVPNAFATVSPPIQKVDVARLAERLERRVADAKRQESKKGKGVGAEAQALFNALDKMFSTRWHETDIIVDDAVRVAPPYTSESCRAPKGKEKVLEHIRKVVDGERRKYAERERGKSPLPPQVKKGG